MFVWFSYDSPFIFCKHIDLRTFSVFSFFFFRCCRSSKFATKMLIKRRKINVLVKRIVSIGVVLVRSFSVMERQFRGCKFMGTVYINNQTLTRLIHWRNFNIESYRITDDDDVIIMPRVTHTMCGCLKEWEIDKYASASFTKWKPLTPTDDFYELTTTNLQWVVSLNHLSIVCFGRWNRNVYIFFSTICKSGWALMCL